VAARLQLRLRQHYPDLPLDPARPFEHMWSTAAGFTPNGAPVWGALAPGLWISAGCNGGGIVSGTLFGTLLARKALGQIDLEVSRLFGAARWIAPPLLRHLGQVTRSLGSIARVS
jgi:glycine/D-amino acid oxidase-like deaminating enzyme